MHAVIVLLFFSFYNNVNISNDETQAWVYIVS